MRQKNRFLFLGGMVLALSAATSRAQDVVVYDDALQNSFQDYSFFNGAGDYDLLSPTYAHAGTKSISLRGNAAGNNALAFFHAPAYNTAQYPTIHFWIHGGTVGGQQFTIALENSGNGAFVSGSLSSYISGGAPAAGAWREVTVNIGAAPLSYAGNFDKIDIQVVSASQPFAYFDDISLVPPVAPPAGNLIQINQNISIDAGYPTFLSDRFTWRDAADKPRVAVLTHNNPEQEVGPPFPAASPYPNRGGSLREFRYQLPADNFTRIANVTDYGNGGYGGFGYVVSHASNYAGCVNPDDSPLGFGTAGQYQRVFEGRHHVIFRFTQNYPRSCSKAPVIARTTPVTIDWVFSTGHDNPLWAVTYDMSAITADVLEDDSRGPYGELNMDGDGTTTIDGVAWGDRYKFTSTGATPVTYNSSWTWNTPNTIPYVKEWIGGAITASHTKDATMGIVQTQTIIQQDAGGYFGSNRWNTTSAAGNACAANAEYPGSAAHLMPCSFNWDYQAINYSMGAAAGGNDNVGTRNSRLAWGTDFGFLGATQYHTNGTSYWGGPLPDNTAPGWPKKSYSTYIVLGPHSTLPVEAQVTQVETVQSLTLTASVGTRNTSGPAGINRADTVTYAPAGYNHVYGALAFTASANNLTANIGVGSGTLKKPLVIVGGYTGGYPTVKLASATLVQDVDYFPSLRASANELWITLNGNLTGATNSLQIIGSGAPAPTITPSGPTTFCAGGSVTLTASAGDSYLWSPGGATTQAILVTASGSYTVTVTIGGIPGTSAATVVTVNPVPATPVITPVGGTTFCAGGSVTLNSNSASGNQWYLAGNLIGSATNQGYSATASGSYTVRVSASGCTSADSPAIGVTVNPIPATPVITAPSSTTAGTAGLIASAVSHAGSTYLWGITNGTITGGQTTNQITFTAGAVGSVGLSVIETTSGCPSAQANASVPVGVVTAFSLRTLSPCRVFDTRNAAGSDAASPALAAGATRTFQPVGRCSVPATAKAISVNTTITGATTAGSLLLYPADLVSAPVATSINFAAGVTRANNGLVLLATDGTGFKVVNGSAGSVQFILDVNGWFE